MFSDRIREFAEAYDVQELIRRFDVDFDVPMRHGYAIGILRMVDAFAPSRSTTRQAVRVGAYWCDIVRTDVEYDLLEGLRLVDLSRADAEALRDSLRHDSLSGERFAEYATARWFDGTGKILYRVGSFGRARMSFQTAVEIAERSELWWCLPDLRSNFLRVQFEEARQSEADLGPRDPGDLLPLLERARDETREVGEARGISLTEPTADVRAREFLRGYSSLLHNLAITSREAGRLDASRTASAESLAISEKLGDGYRIGQSLSHQARLDPEQAIERYERVLKGSWRRGRRIARQNLAGLRRGEAGWAEIRALLKDLNDDLTEGRSVGMDIDIHAHTVRLYGEMIGEVLEQVDPSERRRLLDDLADQRLRMARSVRRAVALPVYKRAYASAIRPNYLERVADLLDQRTADSEQVIEDAFGLTEESSARELLDLLASSALRETEPPATDPADPTTAAPEPSDQAEPLEPSDQAEPLEPSDQAEPPEPAQQADQVEPPEPVEQAESFEPAGRRGARRGGLRRAEPRTDALDYQALASRESEFEARFLRRPLETAPHDPEIAHRVRMYTVNNPGTCVVRYFAYGPREASTLGAFVFRGSELSCVTGIPYGDLRELVRDLPTMWAPDEADSRRIWELLLAPVWAAVTADGIPSHLVLIPVDDVFAVPLHIASSPSEGGVPLAAKVPLSLSVSATAFVARGRHLLKRQPVEPTDDLAAVIVAEGGISGRELVGTGWPTDHLLVAGKAPAGLDYPRDRQLAADWMGVAAVSAAKPEFFVYAGHGTYHPSFGQLGPSLELDGTFLTQYDVAMRLRLPRNKLTVVGACLAGQAEQTGGGDVVGFLRTFVAAGAGAIGLPLWSVLDTEMVETVRALLTASRTSLSTPDQAFDVVQALHQHYREVVRTSDDVESMVEGMPISLYL